MCGGKKKEFRVKKKPDQVQNLCWILCKGNWKIMLKSIYDNLLNLELLEKYVS